MGRDSTAPVPGAWWAPASIGGLCVVVVVLAVGFDAVYAVVATGRDALEASLLAAGSLGSLAFGAVISALAARRRSVALAGLGVLLPWWVGMVVARLGASHGTHETFGGAAPFDRSGAAIRIVQEASILHALGAAASAGLALGLVVALARGGPEPGPRRAALLALSALGLCAAADGAFWLFLASTLVELRVGTSSVALLASSADAPAARLAALDTLREGLAVASLAVGGIAVLASLRREPARRLDAPTWLAVVVVLAAPIGALAAQAQLAASVERGAHPAWLSVPGFEEPTLRGPNEEVVEAAGVIFDDRWIDAEGEPHEDLAALPRRLREAADLAETHARAWGYILPAPPAPDPGSPAIPRPRDEGRVVMLAVDARVGAARWRALLDALREADVRRVCLATRARDDDGLLLPRTRRRGVPWLDAITWTPAEISCFYTEAALAESWPEDQGELFELRLGVRPYVAVRARPGSAPMPRAGMIWCDEQGVMHGASNPTAMVSFRDDMTTASLGALDDAARRVAVQPILAWAPFPSSPGPSEEESPPAALRERAPPATGLEATMRLIHVDPPEVAREHAVEVFVLVEPDSGRPSEALLRERAVERVVARGAPLARCYVEERAPARASGVRAYLELVVDQRGVPLDAGCTRSARSSEAFCACIEASVADEAPDPSAIDPWESAPRLTLAFWFQPRDADRAAPGPQPVAP